MHPKTGDRVNSKLYSEQTEGLRERLHRQIYLKKNFKWYQLETSIAPHYFTYVMFFQCCLIYFGLTFPYRDHPVLVLWGFIVAYINVFGVTAGVHRFWSHRSYKATWPVRFLFAVCYYSSGEMKIRHWAKQHRIHHKYTDTDGDPYNSRRGFLFSHIGWLVMKEKSEVKECRQNVNIDDVLADPVVQFFDNNYKLMVILWGAILPSFIPWYFWNQDLKWSIISQVFIRYPITIHMVSSINSAAHMFGYRTYDKSIQATENLIVSFLTMGEGWHNYHHVFPWDYRASEFSNFLVNPSTALLDLFAKFGLIYDLKTTSEDHMKKIIEKRGDGNEYVDKYRIIEKNLI